MTKTWVNVKQNMIQTTNYTYIYSSKKNYVHKYLSFVYQHILRLEMWYATSFPCVLVMASASNSTVMVTSVYEIMILHRILVQLKSDKNV